MSGKFAVAQGPVSVSVINLKGGVGKTTAAVLLARHAAKAGLNVLAVDLDPQANLSQALMEGEYDKIMDKHEPTVVELFGGLGYIPPSGGRAAPAPLKDIARVVQGMDNFHVIPSRFNFSESLVAAAKFDERALARFVAQEMQDKDLILIDCAPTDSVLSRAAYRASGRVLVPVREDFFSIVGYPLLRQSLEDFRSDNPSHEIKVCGVLINRGDYGDTHDSRAARAEMPDDADWPIMDNVLEYSQSIPRMMRGDDPPDVRGQTKENIAAVANEFLDRVGLSARKQR